MKDRLKKNLRLFVGFFILNFLSFSVLATDYYFSQSLGNDLNDGLTPTTPFKSLDRANSLSLNSGDRVFFKSGETWFGMFWPKGSGSLGNPIEISSYGGLEKAKFDGNGYQSALLIYNEDYYNISNLEITNQNSHLDSFGSIKKLPGFFGEENDWGSGGNIRFGIKVVANNRSLEGFNFHNLTINNIYPSPGSPNNTPVAGSPLKNKNQGYGIKFESQSDVVIGNIYTISNVQITNSTISRTGHYGVWIKPLGLSGIDFYKHSNFVVSGCKFLDTGGAGFVPVKATNVLVENNTFNGTGSSDDPRMYGRGSGTWPFDSSDVVIQNNVFMNARGPLDSYGVHIDYNNENVVVQYNFSYNNEGGFVQILGSNVNVGYRYNISVADGYRIQGVNNAIQNGRIFHISDYCGDNSSCPNVGTFVYNNTVFVPLNTSPEIYFHEGSGETLFKNNLVYVAGVGNRLTTYIPNEGVSYDISNNLFYPNTSFNFDQDLLDNASFTDPSLISPGSTIASRYKLMTGSPAKFAGEIISGSSDYVDYNQNNGGQDFFGNSVSNSSSPHIGAYNGNELLGEVIEVPIPYQYTLILLLVIFSSIYKISNKNSPLA